jgi:LPXTG-motif cell wall-anchored protein
VPEWSATVTGGEAIVQSPDDVITHLVDKGDASAMATALAEGRISIQTSDDKKVIMPITGLDGTTAAAMLAGGMLIASMAGLYASRRRRHDESEQE